MSLENKIIKPWFIYLYTVTAKQSKLFGVMLRFSFGFYSTVSNAKVQGKLN